MKPIRSSFTPKEWRIVQSCRTPRQVQRFLTSLVYNHEKNGKTCQSFRGVVRSETAHCLEAAITAAAILEQHGYPPLVLSMESQDDLDHVLYVYRHRGRWGAVGRSRDLGLHGRKPVFRTLRHLVMSYYDPYIDSTGRITAYALADLRDITRCNWRFSQRNVWKVERHLIDLPHTTLRVSSRRYQRMLKMYHEFRRRYPNKPVTHYSKTHLWVE